MRLFVCMSGCLISCLAFLLACGGGGGGKGGVFPPTITTASLPDGEVGTPYSETLRAVGGRSPYTWTLAAGALPGGIGLDPGTGIILGTPGASGIFDFTVQVADSQGVPGTDVADLRILIYAPSAGNTPPSSILAPVVGTRRGAVSLDHQVFDPDRDPVTIDAEFSTDSGGTWSVATGGTGGDGTGPLQGDPTGPSYVYVWDSVTDVGPVRVATVRVRITPSDRAVGVPDETADFVVDNRPDVLVFSSGPPLVTGRMRHTATLLDSGEVLVAGGVGPIVLASGEVFDPVSGQFNAVPTPMIRARVDHSATLLPDGRVLIAGGRDGSNLERDSAEVFDPAAGSFQATGSMASLRASHQALVIGGRVFVLGGEFLSGIVPVWYDDVEEYDPLSGTFLFPVQGPLQEMRSWHRAIPHPNGHGILVGGGEGDTLSVEDFDPVTGMGIVDSFAFGADQVVAPGVALLQNDRVFIAGGGRGRELISVTNAFDQAHTYNPVAPVGSRLVSVGPMIHARRWHTATTLGDGRVAIIGGEDNALLPVGDGEIYTPAISGFAVSDRMVTPRFRHEATLLQDGRVLVTGGTVDGVGVLRESEFLQP